MAKRKRKKPNPEHYVNNDEMFDELIRYNETGKISETLGEMFTRIANRYVTIHKFSGYSKEYKEDMVSTAIERMISQVHKFDVTRKDANPFAYFTLTAHRCFLAVLKKEKRQREIKKRYRKKVWDELCDSENLPPTKDHEEGDGGE